MGRQQTLVRLTLVIHSMSNGGAERVVATMANAWVARGWEITLLTFDDGHEPSFYPLDSRVDHRPLGVATDSSGAIQAIKSNLDRIRLIRHAVTSSRPEVVVSFLDMVNVRVLLATRGLGIPTIVMEQTDPGQKQLGASWNTLRRLLYPRASRLVVLSETARSYFAAAIQKRSVIIPNPIAIELPNATDGPANSSGRTVVAMGRFAPEKGFDLLLDAFASIASQHPDWQLAIWGDGPLRPQLEAHRERLGLTNRVAMPGRTTQPFAVLRQADLFVMSSRREGFPLALGEAMACGLPAVSFDCPSGPREIIRHEMDGLLVPDGDVAALAAALSRLMSNDAERERFAARAVDVNERFGAERVLGQWESMLREVTSGRVPSDHLRRSSPADLVGS
jgi:GalNAc-alpha-(1->4)-GalNAc-alpha-(1->3)-diNAcBac-PP-undecaprenol alpha-1,4-N-acetyl-D-galactosaminyltransferase